MLLFRVYLFLMTWVHPDRNSQKIMPITSPLAKFGGGGRTKTFKALSNGFENTQIVLGQSKCINYQ